MNEFGKSACVGFGHTSWLRGYSRMRDFRHLWGEDLYFDFGVGYPFIFVSLTQLGAGFCASKWRSLVFAWCYFVERRQH